MRPGWRGKTSAFLVDPLGFDAGDSNLYRYVNNGPTFATDPSGLFTAPLAQEKKEGKKENKINVEVDWTNWRRDAGVTNADRLTIDWVFKFSIKNKKDDLADYEIAQFVTNNVTLWDKNGVKLTQAQAKKAYADSGIEYSAASDPWAKNVFDESLGKAGNVQMKWLKLFQPEKESITDVHRTAIPFYKENCKEISYGFQQESKMVIQVRDQKTKKIVSEHEWTYVLQNFKESPKGKILNMDNFGFYKVSGILQIPGNDKNTKLLDFTTTGPYKPDMKKDEK